MLIGHLPAGYLAARAVALRCPSKALFLGLVIGAVLPDIDMIWFVLVDHSTHHHHLITHRPAVWLILLIIARAFGSTGLTGVALGALLHMLLDTALGQVAWGWPISQTHVTQIEVQPTHDHWIKSFMAHWTFRVELALAALALFVLWRSRPS